MDIIEIGDKRLPERFWSKLRVSGRGCWEWIRCMRGGYPQFTLSANRWCFAHRYAYESLIGPIPKGLHMDHLCRNPLCVNPRHLEPVTPTENWLRGISRSALNAKKTHCKHGHPLSGDNVRLYRMERNGKFTRICKTCSRKTCKRNRAKYAERRRLAGLAKAKHAVRGPLGYFVEAALPAPPSPRPSPSSEEREA